MTNLAASETDTVSSAMPRWDVSVVYPSLDSPEFAVGFAVAVQAIHHLETRFDAEEIRASASIPAIDDALVARFEKTATRVRCRSASAMDGSGVYQFVCVYRLAQHRRTGESQRNAA